MECSAEAVAEVETKLNQALEALTRWVESDCGLAPKKMGVEWFTNRRQYNLLPHLPSERRADWVLHIPDVSGDLVRWKAELLKAHANGDRESEERQIRFISDILQHRPQGNYQ